MFGTTDIIKNTDKCNYMYSDYAISSDRAGTSSFGNDFVWNVVVFDVDDSS